MNKIYYSAIVAIDQNLGLGFKNNILFNNKIDMFIFNTFSKLINNCIVGRVTYEGLPTIVKNTRNLLIFSRNNIPNLFLNKYVIIGGSQIYKSFSSEISTWIITTHKYKSDNIDTYFDSSMYENIIKNNLCIELYEDEDITVHVYIKCAV